MALYFFFFLMLDTIHSTTTDRQTKQAECCERKIGGRGEKEQLIMNTWMTNMNRKKEKTSLITFQ